MVRAQLTIALPCFNEENYIIDTLKSIQQQTYSGYTVDIYDNNSSDNYLNLINSPNLYCADGFLTSNFVSFRNNAKFMNLFQKSLEGIPEKFYDRLKEIEWRAHIVNWAFHRAKTVKGDFIELGVWWGVLSKCVCEYHNIDSLKRDFYLVDSWGEMHGSHEGYKEDIYENVVNRFSSYHSVKLVRGVVP